MEERGAFDEPVRSRSGAAQPSHYEIGAPPQATYEPPPAPPQPRPRRSFSTAAAATLAVAGLGLGFLGGWAVFDAKLLSGDDTVTIHGALTLQGADSFSESEINNSAGTSNGCTGVGGYSDISAGVAVNVGDATGKTTGVGQLHGGTPVSGTCLFTFTVTVPTSSVYTVTISHRGTQTFTPEQVAGGVALTLGS